MDSILTRWMDAARPFLGPVVDEVAATVAAPARTVVVGLVGVGKSTLVNRLCGTEHPTGLGGVTREPVVVEGDGYVVVDTPGIDRPESAVVVLQPLLADADRVLWVVDGLQPLTESERRVLARACPEGVPVTALVARADLLDDQQGEVLERVDAHLDGHEPARALDVRSGVLPELLVAPSPRARAAASERVRASWEGLGPAPLDAAGAALRVREKVRALVEQLVGELRAGRLGQKVDARLALQGRGPAVVEGVLPEGVSLPVPGPVPHGARARALGSLSGLEGAERLVRADAARWLAELQLAVVEAFDEHPEWEERAARRRELDRLTDALLASWM